MNDYKQLSLFPSENNILLSKEDNRTPESVTWNLFHGCKNYVVLYKIRIMCFLSYVEDNE